MQDSCCEEETIVLMSQPYISKYMDTITTSNSGRYDEDDGAHSDSGAPSEVSAAPSALRRGKYSHFVRECSDEFNSSHLLGPNGNGKENVQRDVEIDAGVHVRENVQKKAGNVNGHNLLSARSALPIGVAPSGGLGQSGRILSRASMSALLLRKWTESYWVHLYPASLLFFRSQEEFEMWRTNRSGTGGPISINCNKVDSPQDKPVKWAVDFDTMGVLKKKQKKRKKTEKKKAKEKSVDVGSGKEKKGKRDKNELVSKNVGQRACKYSMEDVRSKTYERKGPILHGFKLERWTNVGTNVAAAFASADPHETKALRKVIKNCLKLTSPGSVESDSNKEQQRACKVFSSQRSEIPTEGTALSGLSYKNRGGGKSRRQEACSECNGSEISGVMTSLYGDNDGGVRIRGRRRRHGRPAKSVLSAAN